MPSRLRSASGTLPMTAASQRLMHTEATEPTTGLSPASIRRSMPQVARDVVEPEALTQVVEQLCCLHRVISIVERIASSLS